MDRKKFLKASGLGVLAGSTFLTSCLSVSNLPNEEDCEFTGFDDMGPFFVKGSSQVINLNTRNLPGTPMLVKGTVYSGKGTDNPIPKAKIDVWHCDDNGVYHPKGSGKIQDYSPDKVTLRGFVLTDDKGNYSFKSILPGLYGSRARHIHYKITAPKHKTLITQSYFEGDDRITHDLLAKRAHECRILPVSHDGNGGLVLAMNFNIR